MRFRRGSFPCQAAVVGMLALLAAALTLPAHAQWKWRDASGRVTVSDLPPPRDVADKDIIQRPAQLRPQASTTAPAASAASAAATPKPAPGGDKELEARKRAAEQQQQAKAKAEEERLAAVRADNCARARSHLATLESGQRIARINDKGEREVMDDKMRADETRRTRDVIASECR